MLFVGDPQELDVSCRNEQGEELHGQNQDLMWDDDLNQIINDGLI